MLRVDGGRADDDLGAVRLEHVALVLADLVGADEDAVVALGLGDHGQADAGVARGRLDDGAARLELAGGLGRLDHPGGDPVLHGAAGVEVLDLAEHQRAALAHFELGRQRAGEPQQRGVADQVQERVHVLHIRQSMRPCPDPSNSAATSRTAPYSKGVSKASAGRKLASAAAYGGGGLSALGSHPLRPAADRGGAGPPDHRRRPRRAAAGRHAAGTAAAGPGPAIKIALLGDSSAAGYGVDRVEQTPGAVLASGARRACRTGACTCGRTPWSAPAPPTSPPRSTGRCRPTRTSRIILIGVNDVTHRVLPAQSVRHLFEGVGRLRDAGVEVLVGTCPDLGTVEPIAPPLKQIARAWSRRLAAAQTIAVRRGGRPHGLPRLDPRPGVRRRPGAAVRARPVPPVGRRLPLAGRRCCCPPRWPRSA